MMIFHGLMCDIAPHVRHCTSCTWRHFFYVIMVLRWIHAFTDTLVACRLLQFSCCPLLIQEGYGFLPPGEKNGFEFSLNGFVSQSGARH